MMLVDTHCHVHHEPFDADRDAVLQRARQEGVQRFVTVGCDVQDSHKAQQLASQHNDMMCTAGIHPHEAAQAQTQDLEHIEELACHPKCTAVGECGLDYSRKEFKKELQLECFANQIDLAKQLRKTLVVHVRDAWDDCIDLLKQRQDGNLRGVFHCFTGNWDNARKALDLGFWISISGIVTFHNATTLAQVVAKLPLEHLVVETDCPYLAPVPHRGKRNEPAHVHLVAQKVAQLQQQDLQQVLQQTGNNAQQAFGFSTDNS
ncbi:MAG: TatD family hydrolase [Myxococcota bacterium]